MKISFTSLPLFKHPESPKQPHRKHPAQSLLELALVLPVLIILLLTLVEVGFIVARYLDLLDLTREAARFASTHDPAAYIEYHKQYAVNPSTANLIHDLDCYTNNGITDFDFFYDTSCVFAPPASAPECIGNPPYCNGLNNYSKLQVRTAPNAAAPVVPCSGSSCSQRLVDLDDVLISVFTVRNYPAGAPKNGTDTGVKVSDIWPKSPYAGYWALSNPNGEAARRPYENWKYDCQGELIDPPATPYYTEDVLDQYLVDDVNIANKGYVAVEVFYCYYQVVANPALTLFVPNPLRLHAYTLMPLPEAQPTPTATLTPIP
jgi:hypothetical protein